MPIGTLYRAWIALTGLTTIGVVIQSYQLASDNGVKIASPAVGLALSGGALSGIVNHVCHLEELSTLGLREAGENLLISTISAGAVAHNLWTNGEKLWVPPLDKYASANASALRHLEPPADTYGLQDAGRLFDLPRVAQCASCIAISEEATTDGGVEAAGPEETAAAVRSCEQWCGTFGDAFLPCLVSGNPLWACFIDHFSAYYGFDGFSASAGPSPITTGAALVDLSAVPTEALDAGVPLHPTPGVIDKSAMIYADIPAGAGGAGSSHVANDNFKLLAHGIFAHGPFFQPQAYNAHRVLSDAAASSFLGSPYQLRQHDGRLCSTELNSLTGLEPGSLESTAVQIFYQSQMRLRGWWVSPPSDAFFRPAKAALLDGALIDNSGIVGLLRRGVPNVLAMWSTSGAGIERSSLAHLFGVNPGPTPAVGDNHCFSLWPRLPNGTLQVFDEALWPSVRAALNDPSAGNSILLRGVAVRERVLNRRPGRWQKRRPTSASL